MVTLLSKIFIKDPKNYETSDTRRSYGTICSLLGMFLNLLLGGFKLMIGLLSGSIAVAADALNNISDALSSAITLCGFRMAAKKPDKEHPFGHGRYEYISGLMVSFLIIVMGIELIQSSIMKILQPEEIEITIFSIAVLVISIVVKLYMASYNISIGKKIHSTAMKATAKDSLSDVMTTSVVIISMLINYYTGKNVDAYAGLVVSFFIIGVGISAAKDVVGFLLGQPADANVVKKIYERVLKNDLILNLHDMIIHDYGPGRMFVTFHAEVPADGDILAIHDLIDNVEKELEENFDCIAVIHMDPIVTDDPELNALKDKIHQAIQEEIDPKISIHDFRLVRGTTHTNVLFDAVVPYDCPLDDQAAQKAIENVVKKMDQRYCPVVEIDKQFIL